MNQTPKPESTPNLSPQNQSSTYKHNPYQRMSSRRAIACTICAKAKTKCDKAVPSCSRCTAKGLQCEPRSTRRTSDSNYRNPKRHIVSPKRFPSANSVPSLSRHSSPRSIPSDRHQLVRAVSQMDIHQAAKMGQANFTGFNMLTPLQTYTPQIIDECYSYSSSPEQSMAAFSHPMEQKGFLTSGRMTPQTPDSFHYSEPLSIVDPFDQYMNQGAWSDDGNMPIGLGFENDIPGMMPGNVWGTPTPEPEGTPTPMGNMWPQPSLSVSPPQMPSTLPNATPVPSLSVSECSAQDFDSPGRVQEEWSNVVPNPTQMVMSKPTISANYFENVKKAQWEDLCFSRSSTF